MIIVNIPIEPLEERYSIQWDKWFTDAFLESGISFHTIRGTCAGTEIIHGSFLDVLETNVYKATQAATVMAFLRTVPQNENIVLFFHDLWNPSLTNFAYIRDGLGLKNLKICGCLHAGAYDQYDFLHKKGMNKWAAQIEFSWFGTIVDKIFVATNYHKQLLHIMRGVNPDKIVVTGFPLYPDFVPKDDTVGCENLIVFPHRLDSEKQPELFARLAQEPDLKRWHFVRTKDLALTKKEYYTILSQAEFAVSFALQETWGIAMQEATLCGAVPLVPNRLSYPELYLPDFIYSDYANLIHKISYEKIDLLCLLHSQQRQIVERGERAIPSMIREMKYSYENLSI